jgi:hypothetical protein
MSWNAYFQNGITYMAIGAGIGGFIGVINVARNSLLTEVSTNEFDAYPNIKQWPPKNTNRCWII